MYKVLADVTGVDRYSNSKLNTIWQCPYSYDLAYNKKIRGNQNGFAECGSLVHEVLEKYLKGELCQFELTDYFLDNFNNQVPNGVKLKLPTGFVLDLTNNYKKQISEFLNEFDGFVIDGKPIDIIGVEKNFLLLVKIKDKQILLNGIIDVVGKDDEDNYYILDHKSKKEFKSDKERKEYARQLYIYSLYIKHTYGKFPTKLVFDMFRSKSLEIIDFNKDEFNKAITWIGESIDNINKEELFLPLDFSEEINNFRKAQEEYSNLKYSIGDASEIKMIKTNYKQVHEDLKDKMFFCGNLCGHSEMCPSWEHTLKEYKKIIGGDKD